VYLWFETLSPLQNPDACLIIQGQNLFDGLDKIPKKALTGKLVPLAEDYFI